MIRCAWSDGVPIEPPVNGHDWLELESQNLLEALDDVLDLGAGLADIIRPAHEA